MSYQSLKKQEFTLFIGGTRMVVLWKLGFASERFGIQLLNFPLGKVLHAALEKHLDVLGLGEVPISLKHKALE